MSEMYEQAFLHDQAARLTDKTRQAADLYARLTEAATTPAARDQFAKLHREKVRHVLLAERLQEILE